MYNVILFTGVNQSADHASTPPIGAYKVAHSIRQMGYSCLVVNHLTEYTIDELCNLLNQALNKDTFLIGISFTFLDGYLELDNTKLSNSIRHETDIKIKCIIDTAKNVTPGVKLVAGGPQVTTSFRDKIFDYGVIGYAEGPILNLIEHLKNAVALQHGFKNIHGIYIIDGFKYSSYVFKNTTMTWLPIDVVNHNKLPIEIGRGCIFKCAFCSFPMNGMKTSEYVKDVNTIIEELQFNYDHYGIYQYSIVDDTFNDSREKLVAMRDAIATLSFRPKFWCYARLDLICAHPETLDMLYDIGIRSIYFGIETLNSRSGRTVGKGYSREKQLDMLAHIKQKYPDIKLHGSFIIGAPHEPLESIKETLSSLMNGSIDLDSFSTHVLGIHSNKENGSDIDKNYTKYGYVDKGWDHLPQDQQPYKLINWGNEFIDRDTAVSLLNEIPAHIAQRNQLLASGGKFIYETQSPKWDFIAKYKNFLLELLKHNSNN